MWCSMDNIQLAALMLRHMTANRNYTLVQWELKVMLVIAVIAEPKESIIYDSRDLGIPHDAHLG